MLKSTVFGVRVFLVASPHDRHSFGRLVSVNHGNSASFLQYHPSGILSVGVAVQPKYSFVTNQLDRC